MNLLKKKSPWKVVIILAVSLILIELLYIAAIFNSGTVIVMKHYSDQYYGIPTFSSITSADYRYYAIFNKYAYRIPFWQAWIFDQNTTDVWSERTSPIYITDKLDESEKGRYENGYIYEDKEEGRLFLSDKPNKKLSLEDIENMVKIYKAEKKYKENNTYYYSREETQKTVYSYVIEKHNNKTIIANNGKVYYIKDNEISQVYDSGNRKYQYFKCVMK